MKKILLFISLFITAFSYGQNTHFTNRNGNTTSLRNGSVFNVLDFGAIPDGITDNTSILRTMFTSVPDGSIVLFPYGNYIVSDTIGIKKSIEIVGQGYAPIDSFYTDSWVPSSGATYITMTAVNKDVFRLRSDAANNKSPIIQIHNLTIRDVTGSFANTASGIAIYENITQPYFYDLTIKGFSVQINSLASEFCHVKNVRFWAPLLYGFKQDNTSNPDAGGLIINDCTFLSGKNTTHAPKYAIYIRGAGGIQIHNNFFNAQGVFSTPSQFDSFIYSDFQGGATSDVYITNNNMENYRNYAVDLHNFSGSTCYNINVSHNQIGPYSDVGDSTKNGIRITKFTNVNAVSNYGLCSPSVTYAFVKIDSCTKVTYGASPQSGWGDDSAVHSTSVERIITTSLLPATVVPGGSTTQVQFNNAGAFGGSANFTWDNSNSILNVVGYYITKAGGQEFWKDATPTKAFNIGPSVPGVAVTDDALFSTYNGSAWLEKMRLKNIGILSMTSSRFELAQGAAVAAANDLTLGLDGNLFSITGNTTINAITTANWQAGSRIAFIFTGTPTLKHNTAGGAGTAKILLSGSVDYVAAANDYISLQYDGTVWHEANRKLAGAVGNYVFSNGITESPAGTVKLGGTLTANTTIDASTFTLTETSAATGTNSTLIVNNTSTGSAITAASTSQTTISASASTSGTGGAFSSSSGTGMTANSTSGLAGTFTVLPSSTNTVVPVIQIIRSSSGTAANGIGGSLDFYEKNTTGTIASNTIQSKLTDATGATVTSQLAFRGITGGGAMTDLMTIGGDGTITSIGGIVRNLVKISATGTYNALGTDYTIVFTGSTATLVYPTVNLVSGRHLNLVNQASGSVTIPTTTIGNASTTTTMTTGQNFQVEYDGTIWRKIN
jgi:Pectate lyase superfamily protein